MRLAARIGMDISTVAPKEYESGERISMSMIVDVLNGKLLLRAGVVGSGKLGWRRRLFFVLPRHEWMDESNFCRALKIG